MNTDRWRQIEEIFNKAIGLSSEDRKRYLTKKYAWDPSLREEIESLISSHEEDSPFLQGYAFERGLRILADETAIVVPGDRIGSYKILSRLGSGGMGSVYLAIDSRLGRKVAIKFLSSVLVEDVDRIRRFRLEARAASKISHPNVAAIYEISSFEEKRFIAMEFVDGVTLRERLVQQRPSLKEAIDVAIQVALAIESAHAVGIVHRDVKPENVMIRRDGYVKVLDFGLAKLTEAYHLNSVQINALEPSTITQAIPTEPGFLMGTATYMSPEQARGLDVDERTDIWSWGVVLYEMVAGETPFQGATTSDLLADILRGEPRLFLSNSRTLPDSLRGILHGALAKEREQRYKTITEALNKLRAFQKSIEAGPHFAGNDLENNVASNSPLLVPSLKTAQTAPADITDSHVIADNFPTTPTKPRRSFSLIPEEISAAVHRKRWPVAVMLGVAILLILIPLVQWFRHREVVGPPLEFTKLPNEENVIEAVLSPDGKYIASIVDEAGLQNLEIRQTNTSANLKVVSAKQEELGGLTFSPDGDNVYYLEYEQENVTLYSISVLGGAPRKLSKGLITPVTFSPDGSRMAYIRANLGGTSLFTSNSDGTDEMTLVELKYPEVFASNQEYSTGPAWSPDGKMIASPVFDVSEPSKADVIVVQLADGSIRRINKQKGFFARVRKSVWLPESNGLIMTAKDKQTAPHQLWLLSLSSGEARNITNDAEDYIGLSATRDRRTLLTTKVATVTSLWVIDGESRVSQISSTNNVGIRGFSWTKNGQLIYVRTVGNSYDLMQMSSDGTARKQLTFDGQRNQSPKASPDGRYIIFTSYREGVAHIWRVRTDGTDMKQLTNGTFEDMPALSPDGKWMVFHRQDPGGLWKVSVEGGDPVLVTNDDMASLPEYSPDGKVIAYITRSGKANSAWQIAIIPADGGPITRSFEIPAGFNLALPDIHWTYDGWKITYSLSLNGTSNIWGQPIGGEPPVQMTSFVEGQIFNFGWSSDRRLACVRGAATKELFLIKNAL